MERWEIIESYLAGEMAGAERAAFERKLTTEPQLATEVAEWRAAREAAREWAEADPPGLARAEAVPLRALLPRERTARVMDGRPARRPGPHAGWQTAAAAALVMIGFGLGRTSRPIALPHMPASTQSPAILSSTPLPTVISRATPTPATPPASVFAGTPSSAPSTLRRTDDHGRLIIETALASAPEERMTWVVDPNFSLGAGRPAASASSNADASTPLN